MEYGIHHDYIAGAHQSVDTGDSPTFAGLTLTSLAISPYTIDVSSGVLRVDASTGNNAGFVISSTDDGKNTNLGIYGRGNIAVSPRHLLHLRWNSSSSEYEIRTGEDAESGYPINIYTRNTAGSAYNTNQMILGTGGDVTFGIGDVIVDNGQILADHITSNSAPAYAFDADTDTGMYRVNIDILGFATGGSLRLQMSQSVGIQANGLPFSTTLTGASSPGYSFPSDRDTGMFLVSPVSNHLGFATGGVQRLGLTASLATFTYAVQMDTTLGVTGVTTLSNALIIAAEDEVGTDTLDTTNQYVSVDTSGGARVITLPALSAANHGTIYRICDGDSNAFANNITISPNASDGIQGGGDNVDLILSANDDSVTLIANNDAGQWEII